MVEKKNDTPKFPSFEEVCNSQPYQFLLPSHDAQRLYWTLNGPIDTAISVMDDIYRDPDAPLALYFDATAPSPGYHPVSQAPLTNPKISSVTVRVGDLDDWENTWVMYHSEHAEPGVCGSIFGPLPDSGSDSDEEGPEFLLGCCKSERPRKKKVSILVKASGDFVTVHDYVSVVHPCLFSRRGDILKAAGDVIFDEPLPPDAKIMVDYSGLDCISLREEHEWMRSNSKEAYLERLNFKPMPIPSSRDPNYSWDIPSELRLFPDRT